MNKKIIRGIALALALLLLGGIILLPVSAQEVVNPFIDVKEGDYFYESVQWAVSSGVTTGLSTTEFGPLQDCTRGQVVTFLWRAAGKPEPASNVNPFDDVAEDAFYYTAVLWAVEEGITAGIPDISGKLLFKPDDTCTRAQVATFLWRFEGTPELISGDNPFPDVIWPQWYYVAVLWAAENGITAGIPDADGTVYFQPDTTCNRAQIVTFLFRDIGWPEEEPAHVHEFAPTYTLHPKCPADGYTVEICEGCNEQRTIIRPAPGHDYQEISRTEATCTEDGSLTKKCSNCNVSREKTIPALGHDYRETSRTEATCTEEGTVIFTCSHCGDETTETLPSEHTGYVEILKIEASCTANGFLSWECLDCGSKSNEILPAGCQKGDLEIVAASTCTSYGYGCYYCKYGCGQFIEREVLDMEPHIPGDSVREGEWNKQYCTVCNMAISASYALSPEETAQKMLELVNAARQEHGLNELVLSDRLVDNCIHRTEEIQTNYHWMSADGYNDLILISETFYKSACSVEEFFAVFGNNTDPIFLMPNFTRMGFVCCDSDTDGIDTEYLYGVMQFQ